MKNVFVYFFYWLVVVVCLFALCVFLSLFTIIIIIIIRDIYWNCAWVLQRIEFFFFLMICFYFALTQVNPMTRHDRLEMIYTFFSNDNSDDDDYLISLCFVCVCVCLFVCFSWFWIWLNVVCFRFFFSILRLSNNKFCLIYI